METAPEAMPSSTGDTTRQSPRLMLWSSLCLFSAIALAAVISDLQADTITLAGPEIWIISASSTSCVVSMTSSLAFHFFAGRYFVSSKRLEQIASFFILVLWIAALPTIMNPNKDLAVSSVFVVNSNLYFASWGCLGCSWRIVEQVFHTSGVLYSYVGKWHVLTAASVVLLASSVQFHESYEDIGCSSTIGRELDECRRNQYAMGLGAVGTLMGLAMIVVMFVTKRRRLSNFLPIQCVAAVVLLALYGCGVAFITFGDGPGTSIGNLYLSTWSGFLAVVLLCVECVRQWAQGRRNNSFSSSRQQQQQQDYSEEEGIVQGEVEMRSGDNEEAASKSNVVYPPEDETFVT